MNEHLPPNPPSLLKALDAANTASNGTSTTGHTPVVARYSKFRIMLAFGIAAVSDLLSLWISLIAPLQWLVDMGTALLLCVVLGWQWLMLPALFAEAIPGLAAFPFWVLDVAAIATWGTIRRRQ